MADLGSLNLILGADLSPLEASLGRADELINRSAQKMQKSFAKPFKFKVEVGDLAVQLTQAEGVVDRSIRQVRSLVRQPIKFDIETGELNVQLTEAEALVNRSIQDIKAMDRSISFKVDTGKLGGELNNIESLVARSIQQLQGLTQSVLTIQVDDTRLTELNKHLDSKQEHYARVQRDFATPLKILVDDSQLTALNQKLSGVEQRLDRIAQKSQVKLTSELSQSNLGGDRKVKVDFDLDGDKVSKSLTNAVEKGFKSAKGNPLAGIADAALSPLKSIGRGIFENLGRQLTDPLSKGIAGGLNQSISSTIGSQNLVGEKIGETIANSIKGKIGKSLTQEIKDLSTDVLGQENIDREAGSNKAQTRKSKQKNSTTAAEQLNIDRQQVTREQYTDIAELEKIKSTKSRVERVKAVTTGQVSQKEEELFSARLAKSPNVNRLGKEAQSLRSDLDKLEVLAASLDEKIPAIEARIAKSKQKKKELTGRIDTLSPEANTAYRQVAETAAGRKLKQNEIPSVIVADEALKKIGANASYQEEGNLIYVTSEIDRQAKANKLTGKSQETLFHENVHAADFGFGSVEGVRAGKRGQVITDRQLTAEEVAFAAPIVAQYPVEHHAAEMNAYGMQFRNREVFAQQDRKLALEQFQQPGNYGAAGERYKSFISKTNESNKTDLGNLVGVLPNQEIGDLLQIRSRLKKQSTALIQQINQSVGRGHLADGLEEAIASNISEFEQFEKILKLTKFKASKAVPKNNSVEDPWAEKTAKPNPLAQMAGKAGEISKSVGDEIATSKVVFGVAVDRTKGAVNRVQEFDGKFNQMAGSVGKVISPIAGAINNGYQIAQGVENAVLPMIPFGRQIKSAGKNIALPAAAYAGMGLLPGGAAIQGVLGNAMHSALALPGSAAVEAVGGAFGGAFGGVPMLGGALTSSATALAGTVVEGAIAMMTPILAGKAVLGITGQSAKLVLPAKKELDYHYIEAGQSVTQKAIASAQSLVKTEILPLSNESKSNKLLPTQPQKLQLGSASVIQTEIDSNKDYRPAGRDYIVKIRQKLDEAINSGNKALAERLYTQFDTEVAKFKQFVTGTASRNTKESTVTNQAVIGKWEKVKADRAKKIELISDDDLEGMRRQLSPKQQSSRTDYVQKLEELNIKKQGIKANLNSARQAQEEFKKFKATPKPDDMSHNQYDETRTQLGKVAFEASWNASSEGRSLKETNKYIRTYEQEIAKLDKIDSLPKISIVDRVKKIFRSNVNPIAISEIESPTSQALSNPIGSFIVNQPLGRPIAPPNIPPTRDPGEQNNPLGKPIGGFRVNQPLGRPITPPNYYQPLPDPWEPIKPLGRPIAPPKVGISPKPYFPTDGPIDLLAVKRAQAAADPRAVYQVSDAARRFDVAYGRANQSINKSLEKSAKGINDELDRLDKGGVKVSPVISAFEKLIGVGKLTLGVFGGFTLASLAIPAMIALSKSTIDTAANFETLQVKLAAASDSAQTGKLTFSRLTGEADKLGISRSSALETGAFIGGTTFGTELEGKPTDRMNSQILQIAQARGLNKQQTEGLNLALSQTLGRSRTSMQEINQLTQSAGITDARVIAAKGLGYTPQQFSAIQESPTGIDSKRFVQAFLAQGVQDSLSAKDLAQSSIGFKQEKLNAGSERLQGNIGGSFSGAYKAGLDLLTGSIELLNTGIEKSSNLLIGLGIRLLYIGGTALLPIILNSKLAGIAVNGMIGGFSNLPQVGIAIAKLAGQFALMTVAGEVISQVTKSWKNGSQDMEDAATKVSKAVDKINGKKVDPTLKPKTTDDIQGEDWGESAKLWLQRGVKGAFKKQSEIGEAIVDNPLAVGLRNTLGIKVSEADRAKYKMAAPVDDKEKQQSDRTMGIDSILGASTRAIGSVGDSVGKAKQLQEIDLEVNRLDRQRSALFASGDPDAAKLASINAKYNSKYQERDKATGGIDDTRTAIQESINAIKGAKAKLDTDFNAGQKFDDKGNIISSNSQITIDNYNRGMGVLDAKLQEAEQAQRNLNDAIKSGFDNLLPWTTSLDKIVTSFEDIKTNAGEAASKLSIGRNNLEITGKITKGQSEYQGSIDQQRNLQSQIEKNIATVKELKAALNTKDPKAVENVQKNYGVDDSTSGAQLRLKADKATSVVDKEILSKLAVIKDQEINLSGLQSQLSDSRKETYRRIDQENRDMAVYYLGLARQVDPKDLQLEKKIATITQNRNKFLAKLNNFGTGIADGYIQAVLDIFDATKKRFEIQQQDYQARKRAIESSQDRKVDNDNRTRNAYVAPSSSIIEPSSVPSDSNEAPATSTPDRIVRSKPTSPVTAPPPTIVPAQIIRSSPKIKPQISAALGNLTPAERKRYLTTTMSVDGKTDLGFDDFDRRVLGMGGGIPGVKVKKIPISPYVPQNVSNDPSVVRAINNGTYKSTIPVKTPSTKTSAPVQPSSTGSSSRFITEQVSGIQNFLTGGAAKSKEILDQENARQAEKTKTEDSAVTLQDIVARQKARESAIKTKREAEKQTRQQEFAIRNAKPQKTIQEKQQRESEDFEYNSNEIKIDTKQKKEDLKYTLGNLDELVKYYNSSPELKTPKNIAEVERLKRIRQTIVTELRKMEVLSKTVDSKIATARAAVKEQQEYDREVSVEQTSIKDRDTKRGAIEAERTGIQQKIKTQPFNDALKATDRKLEEDSAMLAIQNEETQALRALIDRERNGDFNIGRTPAQVKTYMAGERKKILGASASKRKNVKENLAQQSKIAQFTTDNETRGFDINARSLDEQAYDARDRIQVVDDKGDAPFANDTAILQARDKKLRAIVNRKVAINKKYEEDKVKYAGSPFLNEVEKQYKYSNSIDQEEATGANKEYDFSIQEQARQRKGSLYQRQRSQFEAEVEILGARTQQRKLMGQDTRVTDYETRVTAIKDEGTQKRFNYQQQKDAITATTPEAAALRAELDKLIASATTLENVKLDNLKAEFNQINDFIRDTQQNTGDVIKKWIGDMSKPFDWLSLLTKPLISIANQQIDKITAALFSPLYKSPEAPNANRKTSGSSIVDATQSVADKIFATPGRAEKDAIESNPGGQVSSAIPSSSNITLDGYRGGADPINQAVNTNPVAVATQSLSTPVTEGFINQHSAYDLNRKPLLSYKGFSNNTFQIPPDPTPENTIGSPPKGIDPYEAAMKANGSNPIAQAANTSPLIVAIEDLTTAIKSNPIENRTDAVKSNNFQIPPDPTPENTIGSPPIPSNLGPMFDLPPPPSIPEGIIPPTKVFTQSQSQKPTISKNLSNSTFSPFIGIGQDLLDSMPADIEETAPKPKPKKKGIPKLRTGNAFVDVGLPLLESLIGFADGGVKGAAQKGLAPISNGIIGTGRSQVDNRLTLVEDGEGVLTHLGVDTIGGSLALSKLNKGIKLENIPKFATGGIKGANYSTPKPNTSVPSLVNNASSLSNVNANVTINNSDGKSSVSTKEDGSKLGKLINNAISTALVREQRPGGLLYT